MDCGAHYEKNDVNPYSHLRVQNMAFPLEYNDVIELDEHQRELSSKRHKNTSWYNDGVNEFMLFEDEVKEGLVKGRLKNPFPNHPKP